MAKTIKLGFDWTQSQSSGSTRARKIVAPLMRDKQRKTKREMGRVKVTTTEAETLESFSGELH